MLYYPLLPITLLCSLVIDLFVLRLKQSRFSVKQVKVDLYLFIPKFNRFSSLKKFEYPHSILAFNN
jgi:hypothetical protein